MARRKKHTAEQVVNLLRQVEVDVANGKTTTVACKESDPKSPVPRHPATTTSPQQVHQPTNSTPTPMLVRNAS